MPTNDEIKEAFGELIVAYDVAVSRAIDEMKAREALVNMEASVLANEVITGSNAETRNAKLKIATAELRETLHDETITKKNADAAVALCQLEIESYKWQIRNTDNLLREKELIRRNKTNE
jgi:hypothetical protein